MRARTAPLSPQGPRTSPSLGGVRRGLREVRLGRRAWLLRQWMTREEAALPRRAAMASSSFTRCPSAVTPSCFRRSSVKLGRTVSSISFSRNAAPYFPRPRLLSQTRTSMRAPKLRVNAHHRAAPRECPGPPHSCLRRWRQNRWFNARGQVRCRASGWTCPLAKDVRAMSNAF